MRHGEAVSENIDGERPLSRAGRDEVAQVARLAMEKSVRVSTIFHSGLLRARQTAEIMAEHLRPPQGIAPMQGLLPQDDPAWAAAELAAAQDSIMLVGHLPYMGRLVAHLVTGDSDREIVDFAPATLVCCAHEASRWNVDWILAPLS